MPTLFTKPLETIDAGDVQELIGWPESLTVEYKGALSTRDGRPDAWLSGGKVGDVARDKLLKEIVALANTSGGHLILGVEDDRATPPAAGSIKPIPRCVELAQRLSQMAQHVDPPIPLLLIQGVVVEGGAGVIVFRVPSSRSAPHRAPDKECYVRRGTESVPVSMREIQDMSISAGRRGEWTSARFEQTRTEFGTWLARPTERSSDAVGIRVTAIPLGSPFSLPRLYGQQGTFKPLPRFEVDVGTGPFRVSMLRNPELIRAILRGVRFVYNDHDNPTLLELYSDGCVSTYMQIDNDERRGPLLYMSWIIPCILNTLRGAHFLRVKAQAPEAEFAVVLEISSRPLGTVHLHLWGVGFDDRAGTIETSLSIPPFSFGPLSEISQVVGSLVNDLRDAAGSYSTEALTFKSITGL